MSDGAGKSGKNFLIKMGNQATPEVFSTVGGLKATALKLGAEAIDITNQGSGDWRQLLDGFGIRTGALSGNGIFENAASEQALRTRFMGNLLTNFQLIDDDGAIWAGSFKIKSLEYQGNDKDAVHYTIALESSGAMTFTPHP